MTCDLCMRLVCMCRVAECMRLVYVPGGTVAEWACGGAARACGVDIEHRLRKKRFRLTL